MRQNTDCLAVGLVALLAITHTLSAGTVTWSGAAINNNNSTNSWSVVTNWDAGLPDFTSDVVINPGYVLLDTNTFTEVGSLQIGSLSTLVVNSSSALFADTSLNVSDGGKLVLNGPNVVTTNSTNIGSGAGGATLQLASGDITFAQGQITLSDSASNQVTGDGSLNLVNDYSHTIAGAGVIQNLGSFTNNGILSASGLNNLVVASGVQLTNWDSGTSTLTGGAYRADNTTLQLASIQSIDTLSLAMVGLNGSGKLAGGDTASNLISGLNTISNSSVVLTNQSGFTFSPTNNSHTLNLTADDAGSGFSSLNVSSHSDVTVAGNLNSEASGELINVTSISVNSASALTVTGDFTQTASQGFTQTFVTDGSTLHVMGNVTQTAGQTTFSNGSIGFFDGQFNNKDNGSGHGSVLSIQGFIPLGSAQAGPTAQAEPATGSHVTTGAFQNDFSSIVDISGNSTLTTGAFNNNGTVTFCGCSSNQLTVATGDFTNDNGVVNLDVNNTLTVTEGDYIQASGAASDFATHVDGTLKAANVRIEGGVLTGLGTIDGNLINDAIDNPGDPGTQTITGNYVQGLSGLLILDFAGLDSSSEFDNLSISGNVMLNGALEVDFLDGFTPQLGDSFDILHWTGTLSGNFASLNLPTFDGLRFEEVVGTHDIFLNVVSTTATPEPSTLLLFGSVLIAGTIVRRKSQSKSAR